MTSNDGFKSRFTEATITPVLSKPKRDDPMIVQFSVGLILSVPLIALFGFTLMHLWNWFLAGIVGLPFIGFAESIGLGLTMQFIAHQRQHDFGDKSKEWTENLAVHLTYVVLKCAWALAFGWCIKEAIA